MEYTGEDLIGSWELYFINDVDRAKICDLYDVDSEVVDTLKGIAQQHKAKSMEIIRKGVIYKITVEEMDEPKGTGELVSE